MAKTNVAACLVGLFLNDQKLKSKSKQWEKEATEVKQAAVLGAGIMGGGIAYQSAYKGTPILMKDIREEGIQLGLDEASKLLGKRVEKGRMKPAEMARALNVIRPTMSYGDFGNVDIVVEAVVENPKVNNPCRPKASHQGREKPTTPPTPRPTPSLTLLRPWSARKTR